MSDLKVTGYQSCISLLVIGICRLSQSKDVCLILNYYVKCMGYLPCISHRVSVYVNITWCMSYVKVIGYLFISILHGVCPMSKS